MRSSNGFLIALAGFGLLSCGDAVIKSMAGFWPVPAIAALRFSLAVPMLAVLVAVKDGRQAFAVDRPWIQAGRGLMLAVSSLLFFASISFMPLAEATAIAFVSPVITALLSAAFLQERMRLNAWLATALALVGVALVLRPNLSELGLLVLLPLGSAFGFSCMIILNRMAAGSGSAMATQWIMVSVAAPIVFLVATVGHFSGAPELVVGWPDGSVILRCVIVAVTASLAHWLIFQGTIRTTAANAGQAVYAQLPVALAIDALVFRNFPDPVAVVGTLVIVSAGLSMWLNQRRVMSK